MAKLQTIGRGLVLGLLLTIMAGCGEDAATTRPVLVTKYPSYGPRVVPEAFKDTILERANVENDLPFLVSGYGLVVQLRGTGDNANLPTTVRDYMIKQLQVHGFGMMFHDLQNMPPEDVLRDKRTAVVRVDGFVPPGAREDDLIDVQVSALEQSYTTSLAHGTLFTAELRITGADPNRPGGSERGSVNTYARAMGPLFVNPAHAVNRNPTEAMARQSLRFATVMGGGMVDFDNPLVLRVRDPQMSTSRLLERRVNERYQTLADKASRISAGRIVAAAQDEGHVYLYMPKAFKGDWQHFIGVVKHLYLNGDPGFLARAAERLAAEAQKPDAPLENISYALEGIGPAGLPAMRGLMSSDKNEVVFAAARAAVFVPDDTGEAERKLRDMANTKDHPFRINAVQTLSAIQSTPEVRSDLRKLVNSDNNLVRKEAYLALCKAGDASIFTQVIREKFMLDLVPSSGPPMIYATSQGLPRIAIFGTRSAVDTPLTFSAIDSRLTITADQAGNQVTIMFRGDPSAGELSKSLIIQKSSAEVANIIARLGGEGAEGERRFDFSYAEVVALVQALSKEAKLHATTLDGGMDPVVFSMQESPAIEDTVLSAPRIPDLSRPQTPDSKSDGPEGAAAQIPDSASTQPAAPAVPVPPAPASGARAQ